MGEAGASGDVWRHGRLERCIPDKRDDRVDRSNRNPRNSCHHPHVPVILPERILKTVGLTVDFLGPLPIPLLPKDPARHVLCFNNKHSEPGDEDVVNLSHATTTGQVDVVKGRVTVFREKSPGDSSHFGFAGLSLVRRRTGLREKNEYEYAKHTQRD